MATTTAATADAIVSGGAVTIVIGGPPTAKGRPRTTRRGFVYTPAKTRKFEAHGRLAAQQAMNGRPPIAVPVRAEIAINLPVPASWSGKRRDAALRGEVRPTTRPDADNYVKAALDAINEIVVSDDSMIVEIAATKRYTRVPQLTITITALPALTAQGRSP
jgi:Holliday junction resolvase RusA-like endonuclease